MNDLHKLVAEKFTSGNSIEVERITITRAEYESALAQSEPAFKLTDAGAETNIPFVGIIPKGAGMVALHQTAPLIDGNTSDGYHTFNELYDFRKAYNAALFNEWAISNKHSVHKSKRHYDGEECFGGGWFIVVAQLPNGQISNHYEMKDWELFQLPATEKAMFDYDNHTSADVLQRLFSFRPLSQHEYIFSEAMFTQAVKDQKDAERYMHLKWVITGKDHEKQSLLDKTDKQIDELMDTRIRSYDE